jgi:hypothetical protein
MKLEPKIIARLKPQTGKTLLKLVKNYLAEDCESIDPETEFYLKQNLISTNCDLFILWDSIGLSNQNKFTNTSELKNLYQKLQNILYPVKH